MRDIQPRTRLPRAGPVIAVGIVVSLFAAGGILWGAETGAAGSVHGAISLGAPKYVSLICSADGPVYFETLFTVTKVTGSVSTSNFELELLNKDNRTIPAGGPAPTPTPSLPCGSPPPPGWYAVLEPARVNGTIATFPSSITGPTANSWSNSSLSPMAVPEPGWLVFITAGDFTGSGDHVVALGLDGSTVTFVGNTTFPSLMKP
jgi:hypothetical protein